MIDTANSVFTEIEINAAADKVWSVLTDWNKLEEWSSSFVGISTNQMIKGERFVSYFKNPLTGAVLEYEHVCSDYVEGRKFGWSGIVIGKMKDHHLYSVEPRENGTTLFRQEDGLHGTHSQFMNFLAKHQMLSMYKMFNKELKARVELLYPL